MGVKARKTVDGIRVVREFPCGTFDLMDEGNPGHGWIAFYRDCDKMVPGQRTSFPFASGFKSGGDGEVAAALDERLPFRKVFLPSGDPEEMVYELDCTDINNGVLPSNPCAKLWLFQNRSTKLLCEEYEIDTPTAGWITLSDSVVVPGALYELLFEAPIQEEIVIAEP